ncbi:hypothetical protein [Serratia marcescens]|uniref:hypothetical protein n=1 Tax=Serratia marcescens TaxID=615 RepID=UPI0011B6E7CE|nr:hypothetical protein [Serratia marcescens]MDS0826490.1 hypothetical protein [Serratia marcescens]
MDKKIEKLKNDFERDNLKRFICNVNWRYNREFIKSCLDQKVKELEECGIYSSTYCNKKGWVGSVEGNDAISFNVLLRPTGVKYHDEKDRSITYDHEKGAVLNISHSDIGSDTVFLRPAKSKQSGAKHRTLILYYGANSSKLTKRKLNSFIYDAINYHRYTSVLNYRSKKLNLKIYLMFARSYWYSYKSPSLKFKVTTGVYIPLASLFISLMALIVSYLAIGKV